MSYTQALEIAGAKVLAYEQFGSYQSEWIAKVKIGRKIRFIMGSYGSCSGCDAFEGEFGYSYHFCIDDDHDPLVTGKFQKDCFACQELKRRLIEFGKSYIDDAMTFEECIATASKNLDWDMDAQEMVDWIKANK